jgi:hypothetical protein
VDNLWITFYLPTVFIFFAFFIRRYCQYLTFMFLLGIIFVGCFILTWEGGEIIHGEGKTTVNGYQGSRPVG